MTPEVHRCSYCKSVLSDDDSLVHLALDADAMDAHGLNDPSEIRDEAVFVHLCSVCGRKAEAPTVEELKKAADKYEAEEEARRPVN